MGWMLALDNYMADLLEPLSPYKSCHDISSYRSISGNVSISKPVAACWTSALSHGARKKVSEGRMQQYAAA